MKLWTLLASNLRYFRLGAVVIPPFANLIKNREYGQQSVPKMHSRRMKACAGLTLIFCLLSVGCMTPAERDRTQKEMEAVIAEYKTAFEDEPAIYDPDLKDTITSVRLYRNGEIIETVEVPAEANPTVTFDDDGNLEAAYYYVIVSQVPEIDQAGGRGHEAVTAPIWFD